MLKLFLLRHGETEANKEGRYQGSSDHPLSDIGKAQALEVKEILRDVTFSKIFATSLTRSQETASIIGNTKIENLIIVPELRERNFGIWEDMSYKDIKANYAALYKSWLSEPEKTEIPEAETHQEISHRIKKGLAIVENYHNEQQDENFLIVGHGGINRVALMHYMDLPLSSFWKVKQDNCCINIIEINNNYSSVSLMNYTKNIYNSKQYRY